MRRIPFTAGVLAAAVAAAAAMAQQARPAGLPALSSRPNAAYTLYLNFSGFNFSGSWLNRAAPGTTPAYGNAVGAFTAQQQGEIANVWARVAEKFAVFNINVTTVDPAVAALGASATDAQRQAFYESTPRLMHTVIGGTGAWLPNGGTGNSAVSSTRNSYNPTPNGGAGYGYHTNWVFAGMTGMTPAFVGELVAHENGHGLTLSHQADVVGGVITADYSSNFGASGAGSYAPVMGTPFAAQRATWRSGTASKFGIVQQNDVKAIQVNNYDIGAFVDDGIGHSRATATALPLTGSAVDPARARGIIVPASSTDPNPIGVASYVADYFAFRTDGGVPVTLTAVNGGSRLAAGAADPGATLRSTLKILDAAGNAVGTAAGAGNTLSSTFTATLPAGRYFAEVASAGGFTSLNDVTAQYYDMGSFFLTGNGFAAARWTRAGSGDWATAANWLGGVAPAASEEAAIPAGVTVTATTVRQAALTAAGKVTIKRAADGGETSRVGTLTLTGTGTLDLSDTRMVVASGGQDFVRRYLESAYAGGTWAGPGLTSSIAAVDRLDCLAIGYATAADVGATQWGGVTGLTGGEVLTRLTYFGDANLDGTIGSDDFALVDRGLRGGLAGWIFGDFDYSGGVDQGDLWLLHRGYLLQTNVTYAASVLASMESQYGAAYVQSLIASVPEPAGLLAGSLAFMGLTTRRRRR